MLQRQLAGEATVTESKFLRNQDTGAEVEVDIVIETTIGGVPLVIGVECTATKRPANIEWIHQIYGKHHALPVNATVLVSKSGYTKSALVQADAFKIRAMTVDEAEAASWIDLVEDLGQLALGAFEFKMKSCTVHYERIPASAPNLTLSPDILVMRGLSDDPIRFADLANSIIGDPRVAKEVMINWLAIPKDQRSKQFPFTVNWCPSESTIIRTQEGWQYQISNLDLEVVANVTTAPLSLTPGKFSGTDIAYGAAENIFMQSGSKEREVVVTLSRNEEGHVSGSLMVPKFEGGDDRVFDMTIVNENKQ